MSTAVITGGSRGIGRQIAITLAQSGHNVVIGYYGNHEEAQKTKDEVEKFGGGKCILVQVDVSDEEQAQNLIDTAVKEFHSIDILVNNAGITKDGLLVRMSEADFDKVIDTNLKGTFLCGKIAATYMMKAKKGNIINITSVVGIIGNKAQANYAASKAGVIGLTKSMAKELASRNIRVNAVAPGFIKTEMTAELSEKIVKEAEAQIPLGRMGNTQDVADLVAFLAGEESSYITGQVIQVDGGMVM